MQLLTVSRVEAADVSTSWSAVLVEVWASGSGIKDNRESRRTTNVNSGAYISLDNLSNQGTTWIEWSESVWLCGLTGSWTDVDEGSRHWAIAPIAYKLYILCTKIYAWYSTDTLMSLDTLSYVKTDIHRDRYNTRLKLHAVVLQFLQEHLSKFRMIIMSTVARIEWIQLTSNIKLFVTLW